MVVQSSPSFAELNAWDGLGVVFRRMPDGSGAVVDTLWIWTSGGGGTFIIDDGATPSWLTPEVLSGAIPLAELMAEQPGPEVEALARSFQTYVADLPGPLREKALASLGAPEGEHPSGALPVEVTLDPTGFDGGGFGWPTLNGHFDLKADDGWGGFDRLWYEMRIYDNRITIAEPKDDYGNSLGFPWGIAEVDGADIVDPDTGVPDVNWDTYEIYAGVTVLPDGTPLAANLHGDRIVYFDPQNLSASNELFATGMGPTGVASRPNPRLGKLCKRVPIPAILKSVANKPGIERR